MHSTFNSTFEPRGDIQSSDAINSGLYYTSAYYEEEQLYSDLIESSNKSSKHHRQTHWMNPPVEIHEGCTTNIDLPPILWHGYETAPKILNLTNTGRTILINGQWVRGRPYIEGGPLNGTYIFSQIHFHSPSEHEIHGKRYPLEMHVVHYKTSYLTQERAMQEKDGTVVLVYLFQVLDTNQTALSSVTRLATHIEKVNSRTETKDVSLEQIVKPFTSNYYVYWGSVSTEKNSYLLQWIISGCILYVTKQEADELLGIMNLDEIVGRIPRMKPENDTIFYVEEMDTDIGQDHTCRSYQEWWPSQCTHNCKSKNLCGAQKDCCSSQLQGKECQSRCTLCCRSLRSLSGLRMCCCQKRKKVKKTSCDTQTVSVCSNTASQTTVREKKSKSKISIIKVQETSSCPSVTTDVGTPDSQTCELRKDVKMKVVCSCPWVKKSSCSSCCTDEKKCKGKKKKKSETCKGADTASDKSCKTMKSKKKCCESEKDDAPCKKSYGKWEKKTATPRKSDRREKADNDTEGKPKSSKSAACEKRPKRKASKGSTDCSVDMEIPVECAITSVPQKSFQELMRECNTTWLDDSKTTMSKTESKLTDESCENLSSKVEVTSPQKSQTNQECDDYITTIFEKKRGTKIQEPPVEECTVNFLLTPNNRQSNPSSSFMSPTSDLEEIKCVQNKVSNKCLHIPDLTANTVQLSGIHLPIDKPLESPKEFCVQVELLFHSNGKDFSGCITQEYNLALMYNQNVLQEYKGTLHPSSIQIGNYEKLELVPKYPELDNISIRLQDCTVKMNSLDQLCMRAKFLLKELSFQNFNAFGETGFEKNPEKKITLLCDAVTQYSVPKFKKPKDTEVLRENYVNTETSELKVMKELKDPKSGVSLKTTKHNGEPSKKQESYEQILLKDERVEEQECKIKLVKNPDIDLEENSKKLFNSAEQLTESKNVRERSGKDFSKKAVKELKHLFSNRKRTVYFMYEKVEKDENSGKKIFVGSFRSKDEVETLTKNRKSLNQNTEPPDVIERTEEEKLLLLPSKASPAEDLARIANSNEPGLKLNSTGNKNVLSDKKDLVTLHKPKHVAVRNSKKEPLNLVVNKVLNQLERNGRSFTRLADLVRIDEKDDSRISVYELKGPPENSSSSTEAKEKEIQNVQVSRNKELLAVAMEVLSKKDNLKASAQESSAVDGQNRKPLAKKGSQKAVIIIPVEVESLSKVEVILVEHSGSFKKSVLKCEKEIIPCLNYCQ